MAAGGGIHRKSAFLLRAGQRKEQAGLQRKGAPAIRPPAGQSRPAVIAYKITPADAKFVGELPEGPEAKVKIERLPYTTLIELVAEKFHARVDFLREINPGYDWTNAKPGDEVQVPNVATPFELKEAMDLKSKTEKAEEKDTLRTEKDKAEAERYCIFIDVPEKIMELKQGEKVVGSYPITPGSDSLPAPKGDWFVRGFSLMPTFRWDNARLQSEARTRMICHRARIIRWESSGWN